MNKARKKRAPSPVYVSPNQLSLDCFKTPFEQQLKKDNRWVVLGHLIPWDEVCNLYMKHVGISNTGRPPLSPRVVIGSIIIKHICNLDDRETVEQISENMYMQYFLGYSAFTPEAPFDASLFVEFRKRLGVDSLNAINERIVALKTKMESSKATSVMVSYFEDIASVAAKNKLVVDFHGAFKPNGLQRKYPNVLNFEGVYGLEMNKFDDRVTVDHDVTIPFVRMLAGPMDYTPGAMRNETAKGYSVNYTIPQSQGTRCHQAGMYVVYEAPLQMMCDNASHYMQEPEYTRFLAQIPTTWDETVGLEGEAGEYLVVARKNGDKWYIGGLTNWTARDVEIDLGFLGRGNWEIEYVADGVNADRYASDHIHKKEKVAGGGKLKISMAPGGGYAAILSNLDKP